MATPKPLILDQNKNLLNCTDQFLETKNWIEKATLCKDLYPLYKEALRAAPLMDLVLNITVEKREKILKIIAANPELILVRTKGDVKYRSSKQNNKTIVRIGMSNLSPLEAASLSGDFHLVNIFRDALPDVLKHQAGLQIDSILSRPGFLAAFKALQTVYQKFLKEFDELYKAKDSKTIDELCEQIGECQKKLSTFGLQVFCNPVKHHPLPDFTKEPLRACRFEVYDEQHYAWRVVDSDLDSFGLDTKYALFKGVPSRDVEVRVQGWPWRCGHDFEAINLLCKVIPEQLSNTKTLLLQYVPETQSAQAPMLCSSTSLLSYDKKKESESARAALS